ncbi:YdeI family protein [Catellatospora coxensis]
MAEGPQEELAAARDQRDRGGRRGPLLRLDRQRAQVLDADHFLQRYSRRRPKGSWSRVNVERVEALMAQGRMRAPGLAEVEAAKADGRWDAAYVKQSDATVPPDLAAALAANPAAADFSGSSARPTSTW